MPMHEKRVRDRIPEIIATEGIRAECRVLDDAEYIARLEAKLDEELAEYRSSGDRDELADIVEAIEAILARQGTSWETFEAMRRAKRDARGGFTRRLLLRWMTPSSVEPAD